MEWRGITELADGAPDAGCWLESSSTDPEHSAASLRQHADSTVALSFPFRDCPIKAENTVRLVDRQANATQGNPGHRRLFGWMVGFLLHGDGFQSGRGSHAPNCASSHFHALFPVSRRCVGLRNGVSHDTGDKLYTHSCRVTVE